MMIRSTTSLDASLPLGGLRYGVGENIISRLTELLLCQPSPWLNMLEKAEESHCSSTIIIITSTHKREGQQNLNGLLELVPEAIIFFQRRDPLKSLCN